METNYLMNAVDEANERHANPRHKIVRRDVLRVGSPPDRTIDVVKAAMSVLQKHDLISEFAIAFNKSIII